MKARSLLIAVLPLLFLLQYQLWFASDGIVAMRHLYHSVQEQRHFNENIFKKNKVLLMKIEDLRHGQELLEEHARKDLGMVKTGEVFYQIIDRPS